jgi:5'-3' exoribonuclease 1
MLTTIYNIGVAPRAKMNQQRQRRYRSAAEAESLKQSMIKKGDFIPDDKDIFDSNAISPGTEFMAKLSEHLKYLVQKKMETDLKWRNCKVILSGHDVPGEGEHKIMEFVRGRKSQPNYNPNEVHCLYGLDADLIMLGLSVHEPHFILLREDVFSQTYSRGGKDKDDKKEVSSFLLYLCVRQIVFNIMFIVTTTCTKVPLVTY